MAKITFYPVGNADSSLIEFADGRLMLLDFFDRGEARDEDKRIDLPEVLKSVLEEKERDYLDVVAFTHRDSDHVQGADEFFWLDHATKYQGRDRAKIHELWVPACFILEEGLEGSARAIRQEARYRLKEGKAILVFGNPGVLDDWLRKNKIRPEDRSHLIRHAGECVDSFVTRDNGKAEIFVHAPFSFQMEGKTVDQNAASLVLHMTFFEGNNCSRVFFGADTPYDVWEAIVYKTEQKQREDRLQWDIFYVSHHCSYTALAPDKGKDETEPVSAVKRLFERGERDCYLVCSSEPIPSEDTDQPPHRQAAGYYKKVAAARCGEFLVTMERPNREYPKPIVLEISEHGVTWRKMTGVAVGVSSAARTTSQRQGHCRDI